VQSVPAEYWERFDGMTVVKKLAGAEAPPLFRMLGLGDADAMYIAATGAGHTLSPAGYRPGALNMTYSFVRPVVPDGRTLDISGRATEQHEDLVLASATVADGEGRSLATLHETSLVLPVRSRPQPTAESMLATVVFTDLVGSTARLSALGDERWQTLLAETSGGRPAAPGSFPRPGGQDHRRPPATPERRRATRSLSAPPSPPTCRAGTWPGPGR
jgi:hypothetical protein